MKTFLFLISSIILFSLFIFINNDIGLEQKINKVTYQPAIVSKKELKKEIEDIFYWEQMYVYLYTNYQLKFILDKEKFSFFEKLKLKKNRNTDLFKKHNCKI